MSEKNYERKCISFIDIFIFLPSFAEKVFLNFMFKWIQIGTQLFQTDGAKKEIYTSSLVVDLVS